MAANYEHLKERQNELFGLISRVIDNLRKSGQQNITLGSIRSRQRLLREYYDDFKSNHLSMMLAPDHEKRTYFKTQQGEVCAEKYSEQLGILMDMEAQALQAEAQLTPTVTVTDSDILPQLIEALRLRTQTSHTDNRLPKINLPTFDGNYTKWPHFRDLFSSLVVDKVNVPAVEKLQHLKSSLQGEALALISNLAITAVNFETAWEKLKIKYENKRLLVSAHLETLETISDARYESAFDLKRILLSTVEVKDALETLGRPVGNHEDWLVFKTVKHLDPRTRRDWETENGDKMDPLEFNTLQQFLEKRIKALEAIQPQSHSSSPPKQGSSVVQSKKGKSSLNTHFSATSNTQNKVSKCSLCSQGHYISKCAQYQSLNPNMRKQTISSKRLCYNCLGPHMAPDCKSVHTCGVCYERHHTSLHGATKESSINQPQSLMTLEAGSSSGSKEVQLQCTQTTLPRVQVHLAPSVAPKPSLLATALINVVAPNGAMSQARALVDSCSTDNIVAESLSQRLRLPRKPARFPVRGTGDSPSCTTRGLVSFEVRPHFKSDYQLTVDAYVVGALTNYMTHCRREQVKHPHLEGLNLADPDISSTQPFEIILGVKTYSRILEEGIRKGPDAAPVAQRTSLGWLLLGELPVEASTTNLVSHQSLVDPQLPLLLEKFWEQEEIPDKLRPLSDTDKYVEEHYKKTHSRGQDGRYTVRLPVKQPESQLGDSLTPAIRMFQHMERRLQRNEELRKQYTDFMNDYLDLGHVEKVDTTKELKPPRRSFYLPHHGVLKETSTTTKLRVVFNGSQKTNIKTSLNDQLHVGPKLLPELPEVLIKWRSHKVAFSADMEKMYRQIWVNEEDRDLQRFLWYDADERSMATFRLTTVPFGLTPSPFLAIRTLHQLAEDEGENFPIAADVLKTDAYVDDILSGADDLPTALNMQEQLINLLKAGGFSLRKWTSNNPQLLNHLAPDMIAQSNLNWQSGPAYQMLGLTWQPASDHFVFNVKTTDLPEKITKRVVLSLIAQLFDPLGWLAPATVSAKIFMQSLWQLNLGWDDPLPDFHIKKWKAYYSQLHLLTRVKIPRHLGLTQCNKLCEIHGFADASEQAYSAALYLRVSNDLQSSAVTLIAAKTKVAPLKTISLPKLELNAAMLLAKLVSQMRTTLSLQTTSVHLHSDSTITLHWINAEPTKWKTFVANRVSQIQRLVPDAHWHHVKSEDNPADIATREIEIEDFMHRDNWWTCSALNLTTAIPWPNVSCAPHLYEVPEKKMIATHQTTLPAAQKSWSLIHRFSELKKLLIVTAWILRYFSKLANNRKIQLSLPGFSSVTSAHTSLLTLELHNAKLYCARQTQRQYFQPEIDQLQVNSRAIIKGVLSRLTPFLDEHGILRVGGRLQHSLLDEDEKHPIILPNQAEFTALVIRHHHQAVLHGGTQATLSHIRRKFWIIRGRAAVKSAIYNCIPCWRQRQNTAEQIMANLPRARVVPTRPFFKTGIDYAGPIAVRTSKGRGHQAYKGYIAVFVCMNTRAIHLEVVSDYSAESFIAAYKRFTARRGICAHLYSDQGTTLVGADTELRKMFSAASKESQLIENSLAHDGTQWHFNPPGAPHFGGLWEAGVKSVKHHLKRTIGDTTLTFEELSTLLAQIEACLNSRPLQAMTDDPDDFSAITPGHYLMGSAPTTVPEPSLADVPVNRLNRWQLTRQQCEHFWQKWSHDYLHELQLKSKWRYQQPQVKVGDLALLKDELLPPSKWALARVIEVHPGSDGLVRVVTIRTKLKTKSTTVKRPITKLCLLPRATDEEEDITRRPKPEDSA